MRTVRAEHRLACLILSAALGALRRLRVYQVEWVRSLVLLPGTDAASIACDGEATPVPDHLTGVGEVNRVIGCDAMGLAVTLS